MKDEGTNQSLKSPLHLLIHACMETSSELPVPADQSVGTHTSDSLWLGLGEVDKSG